MRSFRVTPFTMIITGVVAGSMLVPATLAVAAGKPAASAVPSASTAQPQAGTVAPVVWGDCSDPTLQTFGAECGTISVPLDYHRPNGATVQLALSRVKHTVPASQYQGVMLVNPGGPGGSGLGLSILGNFVPKDAGNAYDWIGFDPRGVGSSVPALTCQKDYFSGNRPYYVPETLALEKTWLDRSRGYAAACASNGPLLSHMKTTDAARDMDRIRASLGREQLNFYGFSYGTYLGQVYATLFPHRVRRMVLDSNVDPTRVWYQANLDQDIAFERNMKIWWTWVAENDATYHLGKTEKAVEKAWYAEQRRLRKAPAGGTVGADEWNDIFLGAGYYQITWTELAGVWSDWVTTHDPAPVVAEYESADSPGDDNGFAVYDAVQCTDVQWPKKWSTWRRDNWRVYQKAPFETWGNAWYNAGCLTWPAKAGHPVNVSGRKVPGILLVGETLDAATPYSGSLEVRRRFPRSRLIGLPGGTSHAFSLFGDACLDDQIADYLASGKLPARKPGDRADTTCAPLPVPVPEGAARLKSPASNQHALLDKLLHGRRL